MLEYLLDNVKEGVFVSYKEKCIFINKSALEMIGFEKYEVIGKNINSLFYYNTKEDYPDQLMLQNRAFIIRKDGTFLRVAIDSYYNDLLKSKITIFRDISKEEKYERARIILSGLNYFLARIDEGQEEELKLFQVVCDLFVHVGKFKVAFIGKLFNGSVVKKLYLASDINYINDIEVPINEINPISFAIKEKRAYFSSDIIKEDKFSDFIKTMREMGIYSFALVPFEVENDIFILGVYSSLSNEFDINDLDFFC